MKYYKSVSALVNKVNWQMHQVHYITRDEWNEKIDELADGERVFEKNKIEFWMGKNDKFYIDTKSIKNYTTIYCKKNGEYMIFSTNQTNDQKNTDTLTRGQDVKKFYDAKFKEIYGKGYTATFGKSFGVDAARYVPSQVIFNDEFLRGKHLFHVYKADIKSAYPWALSQSLPDTYGAVIVNKRVEPNIQFPFAFYPESNHHAVFDEYSTRELDDTFYKRYNYVFRDCTENVTILFPKSNATFAPIIDELFTKKELAPQGLEKDMAKSYLNLITGLMRPSITNTDGTPKPHADKIYGLYYQAAVVVGRVAVRMIRTAKKLLEEKNYPITIATDSIAWIGRESDVASDDTSLGALKYEMRDGEMGYKSNGNYLYKDEKNNIKMATQGTKNTERYDTVDEYLTNAQINTRYVFNAETLKYELFENDAISEIYKKGWND